jgi:hypothetical protein
MKAVSALFVFVVGCTGYVGETHSPINIEQPQLTVADDYRTWPTFLLNVQRSDSAQVRDIYINDVGATAEQGAPFPEGTTMVMDLFAAQKDEGGTLLTNDDGTLLKGDLLKIFVMEKQTGWGQFAESGLQNGDWMYAAYASDGHTELTDPVSTCFACHLPLGESKDWVQRYDEYFQARMGSASAGPASP